MWDMGEIPMPGGWLLSSAWMPMCGQTWAGAAAAFVGMWAVMMLAMMLPSLVPMLWRLRPALAAVAGAGYFIVWSGLGLVVFAMGAAFAQAAMQMPALARAVPVSMAIVVVLAGAFQFTAWKTHHLTFCRPASACDVGLPADAAAAWRYGVHLGLRCNGASAGLTAILLVVGVMDLRAMAAVAAAITAERLAPDGQRVAWAVGAVSIVAGVYLMGRAAWLL
jgi:predicted metal-binding membrane protein